MLSRERSFRDRQELKIMSYFTDRIFIFKIALYYSSFYFLYNHGVGGCRVIGNNQRGKGYSADIINKVVPGGWFCWEVNLAIRYDYDRYPDIWPKLDACVKKYIPEDKLKYRDEIREDWGPHVVVGGVAWSPEKLSVVQDFLDEINEIIEPIKDRCECGADGFWYCTDYPFAEATWMWTDDGFKVVGTEY